MMDKKSKMSFEHLQAVRSACIKNAEEFVNAAKILLDSQHYYICYHLAALALEEIGKLSLIQIKYNWDLHRDSDELFDPDIEDHAKKLFWANWGMLLTKQKITKEQIDSSRGLAKLIHENRLRYLYIDPQNPLHPQDKLGRQEAEHLIRLAEARVGYEKCFNIKEADDELKEDTKWFVLALEDNEKRGFILSDESLTKLAEAGDVPEWVKWLHESYNHRNKAMQDILERELARKPPTDEEAMSPKWKVIVRIRCESHSIRPKFIAEWNKHAKYMVLDINKKRDELICQLILPMSVPIQDVYDKGWIMAKVLVVALNIATGGFFWWSIPRDSSRYYERITDLENGVTLNLAIQTTVEVDWGHKALKPEDATIIRIVLLYLAKIRNTNEERPLDAYLTGLTLISKTDIHLQFELNAFERFFVALRSAMYINEDWDGNEDFQAAVERYLKDAVQDSEELRRLIQIGGEIQKPEKQVKKVLLKDVVDMKSYCDAYFILRAGKVISLRTNS
jgi:AbiV family abortive infection protein